MRAKLIFFIVVIALFSFGLALQVNADCFSQWASCTSPCMKGIGVYGGAWYDSCFNQCEIQKKACEASQTTPSPVSVDSNDQWCKGTYGEHSQSNQLTSSDGNCYCESGYYFKKLNDGSQQCVLESAPPPNESSCGANSYPNNGGCTCNTGYAVLNNECVPIDQYCRVTYGNNFHGENEKCMCDAGYTFHNNACITDNEWCRVTYGNAHSANGECPCDAGYVFDEKTTCVPKPKDTSQEQEGEYSDEDMGVVALRWFLAMGYDASEIPGMMRGVVAAAVGPRKLPTQAHKALAKILFNKAEAARAQAFKDGILGDPKVFDEIERMYVDSFRENPLDKQTNMMLSMMEREMGHDVAANWYEEFAYAGFGESERLALLSGTDTAKKRTLDEIFHDRAMARADQEKVLKDSSIMNKLGSELSDDIEYVKETAEDICHKIGPCDWAWAKKVKIMTGAGNLSQKGEDFKDDILKALGFDRKKVRNELGIKTYGQ